MTYNDAVAYIHSFTHFGSQLGLDRMKRFLDLLKNPQKKLKFLHVAGTNGKGSTVKMSAEILMKAGYKVGMYVSPFVVDFRERFQINSKMIEKSELLDIVNRVKPAVDELAAKGDNITEFEMITAVGFLYFAEHGCDIVCLEVGLGGRFDATNVIDTPQAIVITSISSDHTKILGDTIGQIAFEKAGIIKENSDVITYPLQDSEALAVLLERCAKTKSRLILPNAGNVKILSTSELGSEFSYDGKTYSIGLVGTHQVYNAVAVIETMKVLQRKGFAIGDNDIAYGIAHASFPARFEVMCKDPFIVVDGAHNIGSAKALTSTLKRIECGKKVALMGMMADKDCNAVLESIAQACDTVVTVPVNVPGRAIDAETLLEYAKEYFKDGYSAQTYDEALKKALELKGDCGMVVVCGSFYLASDMRQVINNFIG